MYPTEPLTDSEAGSGKPGSKKLVLWVEWPKAKSLTIEIRQGKQVVFQNVIENWENECMDLTLPLERFGQGVFEVNARYKGIGIKQSLYLTP